MSKITVVISYDLVTPPGLHSDFIKVMKANNWNFTFNSHQLPNTTCIGTYPNSTVQAATNSAENSMLNAVSVIKKINPKFQVERTYIVAFPTDNAQVRIYP